jgi:hypothetical protein
MQKEITPLLEDWQINAIKAEIDEQLRIRCINVETTLELSIEENGKQKLILNSTPFNTIPVIHSPITIQNFGGIVQKEEESITFYTRVEARYKGNGATLFPIKGIIKENYIFFEGERKNVSKFNS